MHKILITVFFLMVSSISANATPYLEDLLGWKIRSVFHESTNTYSCYYSFRASNFVMTFIHNDEIELLIMVASPVFIQLGIPYNTDTTYTVEFNGQKIDGGGAIHIRPGYIFIVLPNKENIIPNITDVSTIKIINNQNSNITLEFPIGTNYAAAYTKALECYDSVTSSISNDSAVLDEPVTSPKKGLSETTLEAIRDRTIYNVSRFPIIADIDLSAISLFSYFMEDLDEPLTVNPGIKTIGYQNDTLYGLFFMSIPVNNIRSTDLVLMYRGRSLSGKCKTLNVSVVFENENGFILNYISSCEELFEKYFSIGYVLYSTKTNQILEFSNLTTETNLPVVLPFMDTLRTKLNSFIYANDNDLSTY